MELNVILKTICATTGIKMRSVRSDTRKREVVTTRFLFFYFASVYASEDYKRITRFVNRKDKTYFYALKQVEIWKEHDNDFRAVLETINNQLNLMR